MSWRRVTLENAAILAVFGAAIALIHPRGNFPLNDDWDFAIATWSFARTGHFHFTNFTAVSLRAMVLWGAAWTRLFGQSFEVLRASTLVLSAATLMIVNALLRRTGVSTFPRIIATLAFAFHPIFIWASCTYMTEVPFVFASALALLLFERALSEDRLGLAVAATLCAIASWFVRQTGVTNLFAPLAIVLIERNALTRRWRHYAALLGGALVFFALLLAFKRDWLAGSVAEFGQHFEVWNEVTFRLPEQVAQADHYIVFNLQNLALFLLPLTIPLVFACVRRWKLWEIVGVVATAAIVLARVYDLVAQGHPIPYFASPWCCDILAGNILTNWGLGPQTLSDVWSYHGSYPLQLTMGARMLLTYGSAFLASVLAVELIRALARARPIIVRLAIGTAIAGTMALVGSGIYVDRYAYDSAWSIALVLPLLIPWRLRAARVVAVVALAAIALFDVCAMHDYFGWNRARWDAIASLRSNGVAVTDIDGGSEAENFLEKWSMTRQEWRRALANPPRRYLVAFAPKPGYRVVARYPWRIWLGSRDAAVVTLQRL
jgi:hypothetical protein